MFKISNTTITLATEIRNISDQVLICIKANQNGDAITLGSAVKKIQLHALNMLAALSYDDEFWRATERKRRKLVAGVEALSGKNFDDLSKEEIAEYTEKLEKILNAVSVEWPHRLTHIPRRVFRIYTKEAQLLKQPRPVQPDRP